MKHLPRFVFINNPADTRRVGYEQAVGAIMETEYPYVVGQLLTFRRDSADKVGGMLDDIANGRRTGAKVKGYSIFIIPSLSLERGKVDAEDMADIMRGMADFFRENVNLNKFNQFAEDYRAGEEQEEYAARRVARKEGARRENERRGRGDCVRLTAYVKEENARLVREAAEDTGVDVGSVLDMCIEKANTE